jgi:hypothetical protein
MGDLFKALSSGFARFVLAWIAPSVLTLGLFCLFVLPEVKQFWLVTQVLAPTRNNQFASVVVFAFFVLFFSVLFAYTAAPIYRLLEGYTLPKWLRRRLLRRQLRTWRRVRAIELRYRVTGKMSSNLDFELIDSYPHRQSEVQATRLGNAMRAMETFGVTRYGLDSQALWYELQGVAPEGTRRDTEEGRIPVDFFVSSLAHMTTLGVVAIAVAVATGTALPAFVGVFALATTPFAYRMAIENIAEWAAATKALVNLGRLDLATHLGLRMPNTLADEREMWDAYVAVIEENDPSESETYDRYRLTAPSVASASGSSESEEP